MMYDKILIFTSRDGHELRGAQYLDWVVTTPTMLVVVGVMGRFPFPSMYGLCSMDIFMVVCGLLAEYTKGMSRWVYFTMGGIFFLPQWIFFLNDFDYALVKEYFGEEVAKKYFFIGRCLFLSRISFPIIWVLDVSRMVSSFTAILLYSMMALISKVGLCFWVLACVKGSTYVEEGSDHDDFPSIASFDGEENALSIVYNSKNHSNQSSPRGTREGTL